MTRWQKRLRLGLAVFVLLVAATVFFSLRRTPPASPPAPPARAEDPNAVAEFARGTLTQAKGTDQEFELRYERLVTYKDGSSRLYGVSAAVPERDGRSFTIAGKEATAAGDEGDVALRGDVELRSSDGLVLLADEALYSAADGSVRIPGRARFSRGRLSGESIGLAYDREADQVSLLKQVHLEAAAGAAGEETGTIESASALLARRDHILRFEGGARIERGAQVMIADTVVAHLTEDEEAVRQLQLRGRSSVTGGAKDSSGFDEMSARDIDLVYAEDGQSLEQALLRGGGAVVLRSAASKARRRLEGETIDIDMGADGTTVIGLGARGNVRLELPAEGDTPARVITADVLAAVGPPDKGLTTASFRRNVTFAETPSAKDAVARTGTASRLDLQLAGGFDTIRSADFSGNTRFEEGSLVATSANARYEVEKGVLHLEPGKGRRAARPSVVDDQATIEADRIDVNLDGQHVEATGSVKSDLRPRREAEGTPEAGAGSPGPRTPARLPAMMKQDEPVFGTSDALAYEGDAGRAVYTGRARLWQGDTSIKGERVTLDDRTGDLAASGNVVSTMRLEQVNEKTKQTEMVLSMATADDLVYEEERRRARYTGNARLNGPQGDLSAPVIDIFLLEGGSQVEHLEAYPPPSVTGPAAKAPAAAPAAAPVSITTPDGRRATGLRLRYQSEGEQYEMVGEPVRIVEECRETTGKTLTFFRSADRIVVDGNEQTRTEVKGSSGCSAPRLD